MNKKSKLKFYKKGVHKTLAGHLRYHSPVELRGKYVHREIIERLIKLTPFSVLLLLPWPYEVHHMDSNKEHNCPSNLLLLSEGFHSALTRIENKKFNPRWKPAPDWVLFNEDAEEIPF